MRGNSLRSIFNSHSAQIRLGLSPPRMQPRFRVGTGTLKWSLEKDSCNSPRQVINAPRTACMPSMALLPRDGSLEWPAWPFKVMVSIITPLCMLTGCRPVGSPISACRPRRRSASTKARAPAMVLSSSQVANKMRGRRRRFSSKARRASMTMGKKHFMSEVPKP